MKYSIIVILFSLSFTWAEMWRLDIGGLLQFPIPVSNTELGNDFTPVIGGGGNAHFWFNRLVGTNAKVCTDYITEMDKDIDLVSISPRGGISLRHTFSDRGTIVADLFGGAAFHYYRNRGENHADDRIGPLWGGTLALPVRANDFFHIGPFGEISLTHFNSNSMGENKPEMFVSLGVTVSWVIGEL